MYATATYLQISNASFRKKKSNANGLGTAALKMNARAAFSEVGM